MKTIVHIGHFDPAAMDGVITTLVGQTRALAKAGLRIEVWSFQTGGEQVTPNPVDAPFPCWLLPRYRNPLLAAYRMPRCSREWISSRLNEVALFHFHSVFSPVNNCLSRSRVPYAVTPNGGWGRLVIGGKRRFLKRLWVDLLERRFWSSACFIQAVSTSEKEELLLLKGMSEIVLIHNGVQAAPPEYWDRQPNPSTLLFMGRLAIEQKGLDLLLEGYALATKEMPALPPLVIAGPDFRGGMSAIARRVDELQLQNKVTLPGPLSGEAKERAFSRAILFVHTSRWEGLPLVILEAMARRVPCLLTPGTNMADVVESNACGWRCEASPESISQRLRDIFSPPDELKERGGAARQFAEAHFSWASVAGNLIAVYRRMSDGIQPNNESVTQ